MPQFDVSTNYSQIFWLIVIFSLLYIFVCQFIVPKADEILNNRQFNIQDNIGIAGKLALEVERLNKYYNEEVAKISTEIDKLKKEKRASLEAEFLIRKISLEQDLRKLINQNIEDINLVVGEFRIDKIEVSINLAPSIIEKITGTKADINLLKKYKSKIIMNFLDESFWLAVSFIIFVCLIYRPAIKAVLKSLDTKILEVQERVLKAEKLKEDAKLLFEQTEVQLKNLETLRLQMTKEGNEITEKIVQEKLKKSQNF